MGNIPHSLRVEPHEAMKFDFKQGIADLVDAGFSIRRIAARCNVDEKTVRNWSKGEGEPVYSTAIIIIGMHMTYCSASRGTAENSPHEVKQS
jgi:hypothetical protein